MNNLRVKLKALTVEQVENQAPEASGLKPIIKDEISRNSFYVKEDVVLPPSDLCVFWEEIGGSGDDFL